MDGFNTEAFTLLGVAIVVIGLRTTARWVMVGPKRFQADDYLMLVACVVYGLETGAAYMVGAWFMGLANNAMTDEERKNLSPDSEEYRLRVGGSKVQVAGWSLYTLLLWLLKTCMAIFYSRLTAGLVNMRVRIHVAYVLIAITYIATVCSILFGCHPMEKNWQIHPNPGNYCQPAVSKIDIYVTVVLNVATDLYLISIPAPMLVKARLKWREKLELLILFSGGLFVMMAGILRCVLILTAGANGAQQAGSWACRETFVAVVIGNIPMIYPLVRRFTRRAGLYISSRGGSQSYPGYPAYPLSDADADADTGGGGGGSGGGYARRKKFRHPLSIPDTQWNTTSDEQMILPTSRQQPPTCTAGDGDWDSRSQSSQGGIKVVHETIIHSTEKSQL
ncbi:unnamed protein product [Penicillium nalgiovense]|uniref:Rhodopsin domain-containing protein n=1 Tax=Penicillium nalgiovense TaxID=60175 RepID=A0A9W4HI11_PENNA|nr:unnamed protein product [Penicillium nalgiovense]CAG7982438.1 unnamed protein product [Penicillium nalgiovense]CAG7996182.1 unnamed protein product [Penicillium nalgiovense]CAG7999717.1 unnamed protein product [Penicillium nalgiovense]CAG8011163.1 unnamed protein product [Penicillium nalgiovense]